MGDRTPEEDRLEAQHGKAEENARRERTEAAKWKAKLDQKDRASRRQFWSTVIAAVLTLIGAAISVFFGVGRKADPSITNFWGAVYQGAVSSYKTVDSHYTLTDAFPKSVPTMPAPTPTVPVIVRQPVAPAPIGPTEALSIPAPSVVAGSCTGLSEQRWAISAGRVNTIGNTNGYSVTLSLKNISAEVMQINYRDGHLTDDSGNVIRLSGTSLLRVGNAPSMIDPGVALPTSFRFEGTSSQETKSVSFTVNVVISQDSGRSRSEYTLGCTELAVHRVPLNPQ